MSFNSHSHFVQPWCIFAYGTGEQALLPCFLHAREANLMATTVKSIGLSCAVGIMLAVLGWLVWWLGSLVLGASLWDQFHTLWPAVILGSLAAGLTSLRYRPAAPPPVPQKQKRRPASPSCPLDAGISLASRVGRAGSIAVRRQKQLVGKPIFIRLHPEDVPGR